MVIVRESPNTKRTDSEIVQRSDQTANRGHRTIKTTPLASQIPIRGSIAVPEQAKTDTTAPTRSLPFSNPSKTPRALFLFTNHGCRR